jgi:acetylornithine/N-succinyldiaminopimelate aminotransferase
MFRTQSAIIAPAEHVREQFTGEKHLLQNYARAPVELVRGEGCELIDADGNRYLDMVAGIAVCALGHCHPAITEAIAKQAGTLVQASNLFHHEPAGTLANELSKLSGFERVFFCNSGTEANEAAIKLARKRAYRKGERSRVGIVSCEGSFHGRTMGALAATANPHYKEGFEPLPLGFSYVPFNDIAALEHAIDDTIAAFLVEPVQGESGVKAADRAYLEAARRLCDEHGALLIFDEIQCGMGRLGTLFAFQTFGVRPDVVTIAKSLANGLPIGAVLIEAGAASALQPGDHGTTFGGSPVPCAAALAHLRVRAAENVDANVATVGAVLLSGLEALHGAHPGMFGPPRGIGLMLGLPVLEPYQAKAIVERARVDEHMLLNAAGDNTLRFVPALVLSEAQAREALGRLTRVVARLESSEELSA